MIEIKKADKDIGKCMCCDNNENLKSVFFANKDGSGVSFPLCDKCRFQLLALLSKEFSI